MLKSIGTSMLQDVVLLCLLLGIFYLADAKRLGRWMWILILVGCCAVLGWLILGLMTGRWRKREKPASPRER